MTPEERIRRRRERQRVYAARYREKNRETIREKARIRAIEYRRSGRKKAWEDKNRERVRRYHREWNARNLDKLREWARERYWRNPEENREKSRIYNRTHAAERRSKSKQAIGRVCQFCGRSDSDIAFKGPDRCNTCAGKKAQYGLCRVCGFVRNKHRLGRLYCRNCEANNQEAERVRSTFTKAQVAFTRKKMTARAFSLWEILSHTDGSRITSVEAVPVLEASGLTRKSADTIWERCHRLATGTGFATYARESRLEGGNLGVLTIRRRQLVAFLEPIILWLTWKGVGKSHRKKVGA